MKPDQEQLDIIRQNVTDTIELARDRYDIEGVDVLEIGLLKGGAKDVFIFAKVETFDIIEGGDYCGDICEPCEALAGMFDAVICTEVLEHTANPFNAVNTLQSLLKDGGKAFVTTPFNFRIHNPLPDNWRFTEHGLRELFKMWSSVEVVGIETDGRELMPVCYRVIAVK
jgi:2-polyprenyl-3-methyl-5-hydroxy-6-metoxy-1,4-benzoquinol methylase